MGGLSDSFGDPVCLDGKDPHRQTMSPARNILEVLAYYDLFEYPLLPAEIAGFLHQALRPDALEDILNDLQQRGRVYRLGPYYALRNEGSLMRRRMQGNAKAAALLPLAMQGAAWLQRFPFVRGIAVSGSLSKNMAEEDGDIDYFVITAPGRLWTARTLMHLFKKLTFLSGRQDHYCMNYYIDLEAMEVEEQNYFTAMEMVTLLPACGKDTLRTFATANAWTARYFPLHPMRQLPAEAARREPLKAFLEFLLSRRCFDGLERMLMQLTRRRWDRKRREGRRNKNGRLMGLQATAHCCKPDPTLFQPLVLSRYRERLKALDLAPAMRSSAKVTSGN